MIASIALAMVAALLSPAMDDPYPPIPQMSGILDKESADIWAAVDGPSRNAKTAVTHHPPSLVTTYVPVCGGNLSAGRITGDASCTRAALLCAETADTADLLYWRVSAPAGTELTDEGWTISGDPLCRRAADVAAAPMPVMTLEDFRRLPIPAGKINVQPADLRTLVNVPTNVFVTAQVEMLPTELLGIAVQVRATPQRYTWMFGDGERLVTIDKGAKYPDLRTTHTYRESGRQPVTLTTSYGGEYSIDGGPWLPIEGQAEVQSPVTTLTVLEARAELVAEPLK